MPNRIGGFRVLLQVQKSEAEMLYSLIGGKGSRPSLTMKALPGSTCGSITYAVVLAVISLRFISVVI